MDDFEVRPIKTQKELKKVFEIRNEVFVLEQKVERNIEYDEFEEEATHFIAKINKKSIGCARLRAINQKAKLERIAVLKNYRGNGFGKRITNFMIDYCKSKGFKEIFMHSQLYISDFYEKFGFRKKGEIFEEAGIKHVLMELKLD